VCSGAAAWRLAAAARLLQLAQRLESVHDRAELRQLLVDGDDALKAQRRLRQRRRAA
jgi:hypothetical protein